MDENPVGESHQVRGEISFANVSFGYGDSNIVTDISFVANPGETIAIVGQTGSGKTTLTRLVNRTYDTTSGEVSIDGVDVRRWNLDSLRSQISMIEQDIFLFSKTIAENIAFGARGDVPRERIEWAAQQAQAHDFIKSFPEGYDTMVGERGVTLSGGQQQRVAIARALALEPILMLFDEPTSALDPKLTQEVLKTIRDLTTKGMTMVLATHEMRFAEEVATQVIYMDQGLIIEQGTPTQIFKNPQKQATKEFISCIL
jgi:ATP-binding cassette subfamily B protein